MPAGEDPDSIVRREGKEAFEQRIAEAQDFFDYWIEREAAATDLSAMGAKMQLARKMAETVARVHDPIMRGEVASKVAARIGVAARDFDSAREKAEPARDYGADLQRPTAAPTPPPRHDVAMLCLLALRDADARAVLLSENWREVLSQTPDAEMLLRILESDLRPDDPATINRFMATLPPGDEALVSSWLLQKMPTERGRGGEGLVGGLEKRGGAAATPDRGRPDAHSAVERRRIDPFAETSC